MDCCMPSSLYTPLVVSIPPCDDDNFLCMHAHLSEASLSYDFEQVEISDPSSRVLFLSQFYSIVGLLRSTATIGWFINSFVVVNRQTRSLIVNGKKLSGRLKIKDIRYLKVCVG